MTTPGAVPVDPEPLRELLRKSLPTPWRIESDYIIVTGDDPESIRVAITYAVASGERKDADLICAAVNALPDLLAEISALGSQLETLKQERDGNLLAADRRWNEQRERIHLLEADLAALGQENQRLRDALRDARERLPDIMEHIHFDEGGERHYIFCEGCGAKELPHGSAADEGGADECWAQIERERIDALLGSGSGGG